MADLVEVLVAQVVAVAPEEVSVEAHAVREAAVALEAALVEAASVVVLAAVVFTTAHIIPHPQDITDHSSVVAGTVVAGTVVADIITIITAVDFYPHF